MSGNVEKLFFIYYNNSDFFSWVVFSVKSTHLQNACYLTVAQIFKFPSKNIPVLRLDKDLVSDIHLQE